MPCLVERRSKKVVGVETADLFLQRYDLNGIYSQMERISHTLLDGLVYPTLVEMGAKEVVGFVFADCFRELNGVWRKYHFNDNEAVVGIAGQQESITT